MSPVDPASLQLFDDYSFVSSFEKNGFQDDYPAWPLSEGSANDEMLFQSPQAFDSATSRCGPKADFPYSTPMSWEEPQVVARQPRNALTSLTAEEEERLMQIAMPPETSPQSPVPAAKERLSATTPKPKATKRNNALTKQKSHNLIEKRYRTNLNQKILALRDAVPSLGTVAEANDEDDSEARSSAPKMNKNTILSKARDYILDLEKRNGSLIAQTKTLEARLEAFQILAKSKTNQAWRP